MLNWFLNRKVKTLLINPKFQINFVGVFIALAAINTLTLTGAVYFFFAKLQNTVNNGASLDQAYVSFLLHQKRYLLGVFAIAGLGNLLITTAAGLALSHRIAGPVYRLTQYLREHTTGQNQKPLRFRRGDYFAELPFFVNQALHKPKDQKEKSDKAA